MNQKSKFHHKGTKDTKVRNRRFVKFDHSAYRAFSSSWRSWISAGSCKFFVSNLRDLCVFVVKSDLCVSVVK
jgi:hypothetical protein